MQLLDRSEAADYLTRSEHFLEVRTRRGEIAHVRVGNCYRWTVDDLDDWLRRQRVPALSELEFAE